MKDPNIQPDKSVYIFYSFMGLFFVGYVALIISLIK